MRRQEQLESDFADIPTAHIRLTFVSHNALYAPTYLALQEQQASHAPPYKKMARARTKGKGKRVQKHDPELEKELQWIQEKQEEEDAKRAAEIAEELRVQEEGGIECGCCFSEYPFVRTLLIASRPCPVNTRAAAPACRRRWCSAQRRTCSARRA